jgi:formylmethanofuran dehydrogenase subunit B
MPLPELATCGGCGCVCDDIEVVDGEVRRTCPLGDAWFASRRLPPPPLARVDGQETTLADAISAAAGLLADARAPLVRGLADTTCEAQRVAVAIADSIGATIESSSSLAYVEAFETIGASTATFGEIRDRSSVVVVWFADPVATHPRLFERLALGRASAPSPETASDLRSPGGWDPILPETATDARPATVVVVDESRTASAAVADEFLSLPRSRSVEALWLLRAVVRDVSASSDGLPHSELAALAARLRGCRHGALLHGGGEHLEALGVYSLVRDLSRHTHFVTLALRPGANAAGAQDVVAWQTGFAGSVDLSSGHPRAGSSFTPDVALVVGDELLDTPTISVGPRPPDGARVAIATAPAGVGSAGVVHRMDGVPVPLRAPFPSDRPGDAEVLAALLEALR